ncbi:PEP-CTERM sorting domain-containing protein [Chamaesiphon sp. OTE_20_metabat_361]|uniref:PEP-CTERM sorting domain-containing protein n=1 Tax=Chamaesiphon sp. OTE_20_metabat_361 TaxID=2964689 RepID=UPI00286C347E|nr:PEP-CTERM sorting domain-containing protein [Chamaesiphon sp. OTE_20_metabat_361]
MVTNPGTSTFNALLNNSVVDTFSTATNNTSSNNFYGFTGVTFDAIRVTAGSNGLAAIDNIQFGTATAQSVPEPFSIIGTLIGGTAAFRIRKKLADANKV